MHSDVIRVDVDLVATDVIHGHHLVESGRRRLVDLMDAGVNQDEGRSGVAAIPVAQAVVSERTYGVPAHVLGAGEDL